MTLAKRVTHKILGLLTVALRLGLGALLLWAGLPKIRRPYDFVSSIYGYELTGPKLGMFAAMVLPWLEVIVGIALVGAVFVSGALLAAIVLTAMFTFAHASALYRGLDIACGCFSTPDPELISYATLLRAVLLLTASVSAYVLWLISRGRESEERALTATE
jgi:uncharacterized membrane protein YphA (DoxX/SURF4 family)